MPFIDNVIAYYRNHHCPLFQVDLYRTFCRPSPAAPGPVPPAARPIPRFIRLPRRRPLLPPLFYRSFLPLLLRRPPLTRTMQRMHVATSEESPTLSSIDRGKQSAVASTRHRRKLKWLEFERSTRSWTRRCRTRGDARHREVETKDEVITLD